MYVITEYAPPSKANGRESWLKGPGVEKESRDKRIKLIVNCKQHPQIKEDEKELSRTVDMEGASLKKYKFYNEKVLNYCMSIIKSIQEQLNECQVTEDVLTEAMHVFHRKEVPYYK